MNDGERVGCLFRGEKIKKKKRMALEKEEEQIFCDDDDDERWEDEGYFGPFTWNLDESTN